MKKSIIVLLAVVCCLGHVYPQHADSVFDRSEALNLYLDCGSCDIEYFKTEFTSVNYVTDRASADVHLLVTQLQTGTAGVEYTLQFIGMKKYSAMRDTISFTVGAYATQDEIRSTMLKYVQLGLVPFLIKTPAKELMMLFIDEGDLGFAPELETDKWNDWIFEIRTGGGLSHSKSLKSYHASGNFNVYKITPEIKIESYNSFSFSEQKYQLYDGDTLIYSSLASQQHWGSSNLFVKSLGDHAGFGLYGGYIKDNFYNLDHNVSVGPAFEYNIYPYDEASTKQFRFSYMPYYEYSNYIDSTIYNKLVDHRFIQNFKIMATYINPAYTIDGSVSATSSLTDLSQHGIDVLINFGKSFKERRVFFNVYASFSYVNDQVGLKKETGSMEDLLLGQCEFESDYNYNFGFSISFRFGSKNENTVNPRFDL
jgi:hypothetical protein